MIALYFDTLPFLIYLFIEHSIHQLHFLRLPRLPGCSALVSDFVSGGRTVDPALPLLLHY